MQKTMNFRTFFWALGILCALFLGLFLILSGKMRSEEAHV